MNTVQSVLTFKDNSVLKEYKKDSKYNSMSTLKNELDIINKLSYSKHVIKILKSDSNSYEMEKLDFALGTSKVLNKNNIRLILFYITYDEIADQLDSVLNLMIDNNILHRDIHPGNILFSKKEKCLKLIDFYWATDSKNITEIPKVANPIYGTNDTIAIEKIKKEIKQIDSIINKECLNIKSEFKKTIGHGDYKDGSATKSGWSYHVISLNQFSDVSVHKSNCIKEFDLIKQNLNISPKSLIDVGASSGFFSFNFLREFDIEKLTLFEADSNVNNFLKSIKSTFNLSCMNINGAYSDNIKLTNHDVVLNLNVHMWIYKQLGAVRTLESVRNLISNCKYMFFQTCGADGSGMYKISEYKNSEDVERMLFMAGAKDVKKLTTFVGGHGRGPRHFFMVKGLLN
jgi:serine/threonine protein kinase